MVTNLARSMGTRSSAIARGLARVESGLSTLIAFATQPGNVAFAGASGSTAAITKPMLFAQAGSTGGTIGKQDNSASGGEEKLRPHRTQEQVLHPAKSERRSKRMPGKSSATPRIAVGGQWQWYATYAFGNWDGVITFLQTTASTFHGSFGGQGPANVGIITDGKIRGKHISFLRNAGTVGGRYDADVANMEPPTFKGYHVAPVGACHFIATKM